MGGTDMARHDAFARTCTHHIPDPLHFFTQKDTFRTWHTLEVTTFHPFPLVFPPDIYIYISPSRTPCIITATFAQAQLIIKRLQRILVMLFQKECRFGNVRTRRVEFQIAYHILHRGALPCILPKFKVPIVRSRMKEV